MSQLLVIVRDTTGNVIPGATVSTSGLQAVSDRTGTVSLTLPSNLLNQQIGVTAAAKGYTSNVEPVSVTAYTATLTIQLTPAVSSLTTSLQVTDGSNPVSGASVFVNGSAVATTDAAGKALITFQPGANQVQVTKAGFKPYSGTVNPSQGAPILVLSPAAGSAQQLTLVSSPPAATIQIGSEGGTLGGDGTFKTTQAYAPGQYAVTLSSGGTNVTTTITVVAGTSTYQISPVPVSDTGSGSSLQTVSTADGAPAAPTSVKPGTVSITNLAATAAAANASAANLPVSITDDVPNYEFVNPLANFGRYFTATQARMYIGNLFIEELAGVQFVLQENKVPTYGYASRMFDAIGTGKSLVQGQIMVHFISEGYLYTVLNEYKKNTGSTNTAAQQAFQNLMATQLQLQASNTSDPAVQKQMAAVQQQRQQMLANDPTLASAYKRSLLQDSTTTVGPNAVYRNTPFDLVLELEGGGRTVTRRISNCVLTSNEQIYGDSDTPLIDSYGFIGRSLR